MKNIIAILFLIAFSGCLYHGLIKVTDKMPEPPQRLQTATMDRLDSMQGLNTKKKNYAMRSLKEMGTDSVEIIIKQAGF